MTAEQQAKATFIKPSQVARMLNVCLNTLYAWEKEGIVPRAVRFGKARRFNQAEILAWIESNAASQNATRTDVPTTVNNETAIQSGAANAS